MILHAIRVDCIYDIAQYLAFHIHILIKNIQTIYNSFDIGAEARVLGDVEIGYGAVIGSNVVVLINVPLMGKAVGVTARLMRVGF